MPVSIKQIAAAAGVSPATASRALNDPNAQIAPATRERVQRAAESLLYRPKPAPLSPRRSPTIGVVLPAGEDSSPVRHPFFSALFDGMLRAAQKRRVRLMILGDYAWNDPRQILAEFEDSRCDGLLMLYRLRRDEAIPILLDAEVPMILVSDRRDDPRLSCVDVDNEAAARRITEYLLDLGHRSIALLGQSEDNQYIPPRVQGYLRALAERGIGADPSLIILGQSSWNRDEVARSIGLLMDRPPTERPTACFCTEDSLAGTVVAVLTRMNLNVPRDISVAGFNDDAAAELQHPPLTTMRQPYERLAGQALDLLLAQIGDISQRGRQALLPAELIVRGSTAAPPPPSGAG